MPPGPPPPNSEIKKNSVPKPKSIKEVPRYLVKLIGTFTYRLIYIFKLVWDTSPFILLAMMFMAVFNGVMPVLGAWLGARILNTLASVSNGIQFSDVVKLLIFYFVYLFLNTLAQHINNVVTRISSEKVANHIKVMLMSKAKDIDLCSFDMPEFYQKLENARREASMRPMQILSSTFSIVSTVISMVTFIVILAAISPVAPWIIVALSIPSAIISFIYRRKNFEYMWWRSKDRRKMSYYYDDLIVNKDLAKEIKIFNLADLFLGRYNDTFRQYFKGLKKLFVNEGLWNIGIAVISTAVNCALFVYIAKMVVDGKLMVGDYSLYTGALTSISAGVTTFITTTATIYEGTLFIDNVISFMKEKRRIVSILPEPRELHKGGDHKIEFRDVSFRYPGTKRDVLKHINLTFDQGDTVVLVGLNGAGKTTLIKLLTRLYDPTEGQIFLDGYDIREYKPEDVYNLFGIIFQDYGKYAFTPRDNIIFGDIDREIKEENVKKAAEESGADKFIDKLPEGYDSALTRFFEEDGIEPSIGQWQKLSIARAFYADSDIIILDEPTASLDAIAEQEVYSQFEKLRRGKTTLFVSHRLSSATTASKIVVLDDGEVAEIGNHETLMAKKGKYYKLFSTQAKRYVSGSNKINDGRTGVPPAAGVPPEERNGQNSEGQTLPDSR